MLLLVMSAVCLTPTYGEIQLRPNSYQELLAWKFNIVKFYSNLIRIVLTMKATVLAGFRGIVG